VTTAVAIGIDRLGLHVPTWSLDRSELAASWGAGPVPGRRSVASYDEDVVTMAVSAGSQAIGNDLAGAEQIDAVLFTTTSPVFLERQHAAIVAEALGLNPSLCLDITGTLRAGLDAVILARSLVAAGSLRKVLVLAADQRDLLPGSALEQRSGDAAAAVIVSSAPSLLTLDDSASRSDGAVSVWRGAGAPASVYGDERFLTRELFEPWLLSVVETACRSGQTTTADIATAVLSAPLPRSGQSAGARAGLGEALGSSGRLVADEMGYTGVAAPFFDLALELESTTTGSAVVVATVGDGAAALIGRVVNAAPFAALGARLRSLIADRRPASAGLFQRMRGQLPVEPVDPYTSEISLRREQSSIMRLEASRCRKCARLEFPRRRICQQCGTVDAVDLEALPRRGSLFTYTTEFLYPIPVAQLVMGVVDLGEARFYTQLADAVEKDCAVGAPIELVLRRLHDGGGIPHYFWKARLMKDTTDVST
jgi:3-hydroxy-3-methylglutaryl CoA synthase/uncharacterized OB-fold protein